MGIFGEFGKKVKKTAVNAVLKKQLKKMDSETREMFEALLEGSPELLEKVATEAQSLIKAGESQASAMMKVGNKYKKELTDAMKNSGVDLSKLKDKMPEIKSPF